MKNLFIIPFIVMSVWNGLTHASKPEDSKSTYTGVLAEFHENNKHRAFGAHNNENMSLEFPGFKDRKKEDLSLNEISKLETKMRTLVPQNQSKEASQQTTSWGNAFDAELKTGMSLPELAKILKLTQEVKYMYM